MRQNDLLENHLIKKWRKKMSIIKNCFRNEFDSIIRIKCDTKEISGNETSVNVQISDHKIIEISADRIYWPDKILARTNSNSLEIKADYNCNYDREKKIVTPYKGVTLFSLCVVRLKDSKKDLAIDPNETVTVGEEPPPNQNKTK